MKYILNVLDYEDGYKYYTLLFENRQECERAKRIIKSFDSKWYTYPEEFEGNDYLEELIKALNRNSVKYEEPVSVDIYVR